MARIGVYICECGSNIKDKVNIPKVMEALADMEDVVVVEPYRLLCSPDGKKYLEDRIRTERLTHVVIAACSPRDHQQTFMNVCESAGLNPYMMQLVNIREQCAWVTEDPESATEKATRMIRSAVRRVRYQVPLSKRDLAINPDVLVLGGGVAGIEACLTLASMGRKVYLVEKGPKLGGMISLFRNILPDQAGHAVLDDKISGLTKDRNVEVLTDHELVNLVGYTGNFVATVRAATGQAAERSLAVGALIVATGAQLFNPNGTMGIEAAPSEDVLTPLEFEAMARSGVVVRANGSVPRSACVIHCVGREAKEYCSKVCCSYGLKFSRYLKEMVQDIQIHHLYSDLCIPGIKQQEFCEETARLGVTLVRSSQVSMRKGKTGPHIDFVDEGGAGRSLDVELVILLTALEPRDDAGQLAELLGIGQEKEGFFSRKHEKLAQMASDREGVFLAGSAEGPKGIAESVVQAQAASGAVLASLVPGRRMEVEAKTSHISETLCQGCGTCVAVCPFGAITLDANRKIAIVNEVMCRGCGNCVAACPSGAASVKHFTYDQIYQEIAEATR